MKKSRVNNQEDHDSSESENENEEHAKKPVRRPPKLPMVGNVFNFATCLYGRVKSSNKIAKSILNSAEATVKHAVGITHPVTSKLESPIKTVESLLSSGLNMVGNSVPYIKTPANEVFQCTTNKVMNSVQPAFGCVSVLRDLGVTTVASLAQMASPKRSKEPCFSGKCCIHQENPSQCPNSPSVPSTSLVERT